MEPALGDFGGRKQTALQGWGSCCGETGHVLPLEPGFGHLGAEELGATQGLVGVGGIAPQAGSL